MEHWQRCWDTELNKVFWVKMMQWRSRNGIWVHVSPRSDSWGRLQDCQATRKKQLWEPVWRKSNAESTSLWWNLIQKDVGCFPGVCLALHLLMTAWHIKSNNRFLKGWSLWEMTYVPHITILTPTCVNDILTLMHC